MGAVLFILSMAGSANADEPWKRFEPNRPDWVEAGSSPRAKFFIDRSEIQIDGAVAWAFEQAVYTPGVKYLNPDSDPKHAGPITRAVFLLEFLCNHNTYREVNTTYWYENGATWDSGYPNLLAHGQIDIDNPIFQYMANFACDAKRKPAASAPASTTTPETSTRATTTVGGRVPELDAGGAIVRAFYLALSRGDGASANSLISLEKRASPAYQPDAIEAFYGHMAEPLTLVGIEAAGPSTYTVHYTYRKQSARCDGHAVVTTQGSEGHAQIARIKPLGNC